MIDLSLLEDFISGAGESLDEMETALLELELEPTNQELLNTIFRAMHTIKGAAQFVGLDKVSALSHALEDLLDLLREGKKQASFEIIDLLIQAKDRISSLVSDLEQTKLENTDVNDLIDKISDHLGVDAEQFSEEVVQDTPRQQNVEIDELSSFLSEDTQAENVDADKRDTQEEDELSAFLSEDSDNDISAFLSEDVHEGDLSSLPFAKNPVFPEQARFNDASDDEFMLPDEEYDQELFSIYIQQLLEKTALLSGYISSLKFAENKDELLKASIEALETLKFSANYMAYEKLTRLYAKWIDEILDASEDLAATGIVSFEFMNTYMNRLRAIFPQLEEQLSSGTDVQQIDTSQRKDLKIATETVLDTLQENNTADLPFIEELIQQNAVNVSPVETVSRALNEPSTESIPPVDVLEDEDYLFAKLSHALDYSIEQSITAEPVNEVFGALLAATNEQKGRENEEKDKKLTLKIKTLAEANQEPEPNPVEVAEKSTVQTEVNTDISDPVVETDGKQSEKPAAMATSEKALKRSIRVDADKIDSLMNQVGELIVDRAYFFQLASEINELQQYLKEVSGLAQKDLKPVRTFAYRFSEAIISLGRTSNELQEGVMKVRMLPISQLFNRYPRLVHDLAHTNGKKVQLEIRGEETELDKMIIEEISDPLIHMIRNAIGHGIESPEVRKQLGKPETGQLILEAYHESNHIVIEVTDDGRGIDTEKIKIKAEEMSLFTREELNRMSTDELIRFIMLPGFSTAKEINSTSGRGVGMDVVKKNIEKLNGTIEVESKFGVETRMRLKIPLTLAIIQALLVRVGDDTFTIPLANVEETLRVTQDEISIMEDIEVMYLRGKTLPIFRLSVLFGMKSNLGSDNKNFFVVVVNTGNQKIGLMVDYLLGQEEVVIKPLVDYLHDQNCFSGATIIGDGRISLILDVYELINMTTDKQIKKHQDQEKKSQASLEVEA